MSSGRRWRSLSRAAAAALPFPLRDLEVPGRLMPAPRLTGAKSSVVTSLKSFSAGVRKSILNASFFSRRAFGAASVPTSAKTILISVPKDRRRLKKKHTFAHNSPQFPVLRAGPVLQEGLVEVVEHTALALRHRHDQILLVRLLSRVEGDKRGRTLGTPALVGSGANRRVVAIVERRRPVFVHTAAEAFADGLVSDKEVLGRRGSVVEVHRCIGSWNSRISVLRLVVVQSKVAENAILEYGVLRKAKAGERMRNGLLVEGV
jgi:hypothetical protein